MRWHPQSRYGQGVGEWACHVWWQSHIGVGADLRHGPSLCRHLRPTGVAMSMLTWS